MFDRELVKGSTSLLVLQLLNERDMYGYELVKEMDYRSDHNLQMKEGTLYPALHKLEKQEYIECYWQNQEKGPARKYYRITLEGKKILEAKTSEWHRYVQVMNNLIGRSES
ncbi:MULTISPECIES: PadR family transcriptional regulator [Ornithinibacillus]|uniref:PadR family transcriptional regulator n=2 Tax=Ornithinibacillus TaxID=484508 RepID=A0A923RHX9_9BACI|nr:MULTISPECIES: PadR family transcriptional regulator [Ornithinibacillus]MBC5636816.1 PadR family transcriptional regulator [Ornithinibacillus hominis]MBS3681382.1 PadR family transcriptional regulator [Ornithinibacillus massiliensis]